MVLSLVRRKLPLPPKQTISLLRFLPSPPSPSPSASPHKPYDFLNPTANHTYHFSTTTTTSSSSSHPIKSPALPPISNGETDHRLCPGCGIQMQDSDPSLPGFFSAPSPKSPDYHARLDRRLDPLEETHLSISVKSGLLATSQEPQQTQTDDDSHKAVVVCARCHSLRHYGRVKRPDAERLLPDFDFVSSVGPRLASPTGARSLVLLLADAADFDGSFPRAVARLVASASAAHRSAWKQSAPANLTRALLVLTKLDLLPSAALSPDDLHAWAHSRARASAAADLRLAGVHLVSAARGWGVVDLLSHVRELAGPRGNVWAVGARNVGKSTLLNAMAKCAGANGEAKLTEAPVPGTTLGVIRVDGVLGAQAKLFDTPGLLHGHQITTRLTREEQKLVQVTKEMRPRTYRIKAGHSIHIGGLMRLDIEELSIGSIYVTVWASPLIPLHMGKTENASTMINEHFGLQLQPPIGQKRVNELGKWMRKEFRVTGNSWDTSSVDIAIAGLGWFAVALTGEAVLGAWTYDGVHIVSRSSLIHTRASIFEEAGFTTSKIVSRADSITNKLRSSKKPNKKQGESKSSPSPTQSSESDAAALGA